jgi:arabinose-5-phosphate isomerase
VLEMPRPKKINGEAILASARRVIEVEMSGLQEVGDRIGQELLEAVEILHSCSGKIVVTGIGKSGHIARKIASTLASTGTPAFFVHPAEASHGDLGMISQRDAIIAISYSGESAELNLILPFAKRLGVKLISITGAPKSTLALLSEVTLNVRITKEACPLGLAPTASTTATLAIGDALAVSLLEAKGFNQKDFARSHPGGSLGKKLLTRVADVMRTAESFPRVSPKSRLKDVIVEISEKRLGMAAVIGKDNVLAGIITDGDLRRLLERSDQPLMTTAENIMTRNPKTISPDALASEAIAIFEVQKINHLIVVDEKDVPLGVLGFHDLVTEKII